MFQKTMVALANKTNCLVSFDGNTARLIEADKNGRPSAQVWSKLFIYNSKTGKVTVKVHGRTLAVMPLAAIA